MKKRRKFPKNSYACPHPEHPSLTVQVIGVRQTYFNGMQPLVLIPDNGNFVTWCYLEELSGEALRLAEALVGTKTNPRPKTFYGTFTV